MDAVRQTSLQEQALLTQKGKEQDFLTDCDGSNTVSSLTSHL